MKAILAITISVWFIATILSALFYDGNMSKIVSSLGFIINLFILSIAVRDVFIRRDYVMVVSYLMSFFFATLILGSVFFKNVPNLKNDIYIIAVIAGCIGIIIMTVLFFKGFYKK